MKKLSAFAILFGWLLLGPVAAASAATGDVPPRPLTDQGLTNLTALTRLIGYVRFFHPSDQAAGLANADWDALAMAGVERVEAARNPGELAAALSTLFRRHRSDRPGAAVSSSCRVGGRASPGCGPRRRGPLARVAP